MSRKWFFSGFILLIVGIFGRIYASSYSYLDADNFIRDTAWLPISTFMLLIGLVLLLVTLASYRLNSPKSA